MLIEIAGMMIVIPHECLAALHNAPPPIPQIGRHRPLQPQRQQIRRPLLAVMHVIAHPQQKIMRPPDLLTRTLRENTPPAEILQIPDPQLHTAHPKHVVIVPQPPAAGLHIRFLQMHRTRTARMPLRQIPHPRLQKILLPPKDALPPEVVLEFIENHPLPGDVAALQQRTHRLMILERLLKRLLHRPHRMPHFEPHIPQHVEHILDSLPRPRRHFPPGALHVQKMQIHITPRIEQPTSVPARRNERHPPASPTRLPQRPRKEIP